MSETKISRFRGFNKLVWLGVTLIFASATFYLFVVRDWIIQILNGEAKEWQSSVINYLYPRFEVEIQRLSQSFFQKKADQFILRTHLLLIVLLVFFYAYFNSSLKVTISSFWDKTTSVKSTKNVIRLFYLAIFLFTKDWYIFLIDYHAIADFYKPISFYSLFHLPILDTSTLTVFWGIYTISIVAIILWIKPLWFSIISSFLFIYFQGYLYSFEKINHAFATISYATLIVPFLIFEYKKSEKTNSPTLIAWPIVLIKLSVGFAYLQSGLEKLLNSGFDWLYGSVVLIDKVNNTYTTLLLTALVLVFQLGFIFFTWKPPWQWPPWQWLFLIGGVVFHFSTVWFISIGAILNPWIFMYIFWFLLLKTH